MGADEDLARPPPVQRLTGAAGVVTALGLLAITFVGNLEGLRLYAYQDVVGVWTACYGETKGIKTGMRFTKEQCDVMFLDGLKRHEAGMRRCLDHPDSLPAKTYLSLLSFTYNIGVGGFCDQSKTRRLINAGKYAEGCKAMMGWLKPAVLERRRREEVALCLDGLDEPVELPDPEDVKPEDRPVLRRGASGFWVEQLQKEIGGLKVDGQFGPATEKAVKKFQVDRELIIDGVAGSQTWKALAAEKTSRVIPIPDDRHAHRRALPRRIAVVQPYERRAA